MTWARTWSAGCRLKVQGPRGTEVQLRHAETLTPDGMLYRANLRSAKARDIYTLKGEGVETYAPRFAYHGFRFVEITGYPRHAGAVGPGRPGGYTAICRPPASSPAPMRR